MSGLRDDDQKIVVATRGTCFCPTCQRRR
ncbi:MAG: zinc finger domain-containing protein [Clostridium sp.]